LSAFQPSNIFFSLDGQIRIGDFGLVTDMADIPQLDSSSPMANHSYNRHTQQVGTQLYMSPEQIQGLPYNYKVDIYSLGLILFELLVCFSTEMERIEVLKGLRISEFPKDFQEAYPDEVSFGFDKLFKIIRLFFYSMSYSDLCYPNHQKNDQPLLVYEHVHHCAMAISVAIKKAGTLSCHQGGEEADRVHH
jgi:serine/threonine protein kinase